jgi:molybdopterin/thiamine biosynthesis adenylyltransferase
MEARSERHANFAPSPGRRMTGQRAMTGPGGGVERYARHILLREIGGPGQAKLRAASVALVGVGGLGGPAAMYLAAAGVGRLRLIDDDAVWLSNLQRQVQFRTADIGRPKVEASASPGCSSASIS